MRYTPRHSAKALRKPSKTIRQMKAVLFLLLAALFVWPFAEPFTLETDVMTVESANLPEDIGTLRIVYLSDSVGNKSKDVLCESFTLTESNSLTGRGCLCSDGREGVSVYFGSCLCTYKFAHNAGRKSSNACFVHILSVNLQRTGTVHSHSVGGVGNGNGTP